MVRKLGKIGLILFLKITTRLITTSNPPDCRFLQLQEAFHYLETIAFHKPPDYALLKYQRDVLQLEHRAGEQLHCN